VYGPRTTPVRLLWVAASVGALHTGRMPVAAAATAFITGADGFVGRALIKVLRSLDHQVFALAGCSDAAQRLSSAGATPVIGNLLESGGWQDEAAAIRLRGTGFHFEHPTLEHGLQQIVGALHE
jgi:nucleoside-diphosphate-sugar epimerase